MTVSVAVYEQDGTTLIAAVPRRRNVQWQTELNTPGSGSFELHLDDAVLTAHPTLLNAFNVVRFTVGTAVVAAWLIEKVDPIPVSTEEKAGRWASVSGRGVLAVLGNAIVYPEGGLSATAPDKRSFDFSSEDGAWRVGADWTVPLGVAQGSDPTARAGRPLDWPSPTAEWLWSTDPTLSATAGRNWFRGDMTLLVDTDVMVYAACDNTMSLRLNGEEIIKPDYGDPFAWREMFTYRAHLEAATHRFSAWVDNMPWGGANPAGFLLAVYELDSSGEPSSLLFETNPTNFEVHTYGPPAPGWHGALILKTLIEEAQARSVAQVDAVTLTFGATADSDSVAWSDIQDLQVDVGASLLSVVDEVVEGGVDLAMDETLTLHAWNQRGSDLTGTVTLTPVRGVTGSIEHQGVVNTTLVHHVNGWLEVADSASATANGRRETSLSLGDAGSPEQAEQTAVSMYEESAQSHRTSTIEITSVAGPQPFIDFTLGDTVTAPGVYGVNAAARVMAITGTESEDGAYITWVVDTYPTGA